MAVSKLGMLFSAASIRPVFSAVGGLALGRGIGSALIGVEPGDPGTVAVVALSLVGAAVLAAGIPALRAGRVDPAGMLRTD